MLLALGDGRALPASRLAAEAGIAASTSSGHLSRLVSAGMLVVEPHGRHRYYRLAGPHIADLLEAIMQVAPAADGAVAARGDQRRGAAPGPDLLRPPGRAGRRRGHDRAAGAPGR